MFHTKFKSLRHFLELYKAQEKAEIIYDWGRPIKEVLDILLKHVPGFESLVDVQYDAPLFLVNDLSVNVFRRIY